MQKKSNAGYQDIIPLRTKLSIKSELIFRFCKVFSHILLVHANS